MSSSFVWFYWLAGDGRLVYFAVLLGEHPEDVGARISTRKHLILDVQCTETYLGIWGGGLRGLPPGGLRLTPSLRSP